MAYICEKAKGSCPECEHYRYDEDRDSEEKCCWAEYDEKAAEEKKKTQEVQI